MRCPSYLDVFYAFLWNCNKNCEAIDVITDLFFVIIKTFVIEYAHQSIHKMFDFMKFSPEMSSIIRNVECITCNALFC